VARSERAARQWIERVQPMSAIHPKADIRTGPPYAPRSSSGSFAMLAAMRRACLHQGNKAQVPSKKMAPVRGHWTQGEGVDSGPASRALPQLTRSTSRQIVKVRVCARRQVEKKFFIRENELRQIEKNSFLKTSETTEIPHCLESRLGITDAIAPAASRCSPRSAAPREGVMEFAGM
jgi:hypothetical protein